MTAIKTVIKRSNDKIAFDPGKITSAVFKAYANVYMHRDKKINMREAQMIADKVKGQLDSIGKEEIHVEEIQDIVENVIISIDPTVAKAYILYRQKRTDIRNFKSSLGIKTDDLKLPINSLMVLAARYLLKDEYGKIVEDPKQLFMRVSHAIASAEKNYGKSNEDIKRIEQGFYDAMVNFRFMPNSPTLMNAGAPLGQLSACFVIPVGDSIDEIFTAVHDAALVHQTGGGTGFSFSRLRPSGDVVRSTGGVSSGPVVFMNVFDAATDSIKQGGKRRGANMGILKIDHPNILDFIVMKEHEGTMRNFNISVAATEEFMNAVKHNYDYNLINPRTKLVSGKLNARAVWNLIVTMAWKTGDPGLVFIDRINSSYANPVPSYGPVESTNPCVTGDTLISTSEGMRRAADLYVQGTPNIVMVDDRFVGETRQLSSPVMMTGTKEVVALNTNEGYSLKLTRDHKVYSESRGWVSAIDLKKGEEIRVARTSGAFSKNGTASEGRVLGWLVGDGYINTGHINERAALSFYGNDPWHANPFSEDVNSVIRESASKSHINKAGVVSVQKRHLKTISSERLKEFAASYDLVENKLIVPGKVFSGSEDMQRGFLQGLFEADGTISVLEKSRRTIRLASISERLLGDVQMLLLNFGVFSKIYRNEKTSGSKLLPYPDRQPKMYDVKMLHELSIEGANIPTFAARIGFLSECKNDKVESVIGSYTSGPYEEHFVATVQSLEKLGSEMVYDLKEPVTHSFIANGIVVHNCGEQPLYPYDSCNLGSINLAQMVTDSEDKPEINWKLLEETTRLGVRFLDNVVDSNKYPLEQIERVSKSIRRIGLGVMGWADMLIKLGIKYDSNEAVLLAEQVMEFITLKGRKMSEELAEERGPFPEFKNSIWYKLGHKPLRNSTVTTIAPTGTISIISGGTSQGIEPMFSVVYMRNVQSSLGYNLIEINNEFEKLALEHGFYSEELMKRIAGKISIQDVEEIPEDVRRLFVTAYDISPEWHVRTQAAFQKYTDNAVSKTINFPSWATPQDIERAYMLAYDLGCKGITVYRDSSKSVQVLQSTKRQSRIADLKDRHMKVDKPQLTVGEIRSKAGSYVMSMPQEVKCPDCSATLIAAEGCFTCPECGFSKCE